MTSPWRRRLQTRFGGDKAPLLYLDDAHLSGGEFLGLVRDWCEAFRSRGIVAGDRIVVALPPGTAMLAVVAAGLWEGLTLCPVDRMTDPAQAAAAYDPVAGVHADDGLGFGGRPISWAFTSAAAGGPATAPTEARPPTGIRTPEARIIVPASTEDGAWIALSDFNLSHVVDEFAGAMRLTAEGTRWLSLMPWSSGNGFVLDLLAPLLYAHEYVRPAGDVEGPSGIGPAAAQAIERWAPTHIALTVPGVRVLSRLWGGLQPLSVLWDGIVTGPGVDENLVAQLRHTRLRAHRGAPEFSGLLTLGEPGVWRATAAGRAVGCHLLVDGQGGLVVTGKNLAYGTWDGANLTVEDPDRYVRTYFK